MPVDERYLESPYYLVPTEPVGQEAFAVIRDAMRGKDMVALGRVVVAKRERVVMLQPRDNGLMATALRYPYEVRDAADYFSDIPELKIPREMLQLAEHILETKAGDFEPDKFQGPLRGRGGGDDPTQASWNAGAGCRASFWWAECCELDGCA